MQCGFAFLEAGAVRSKNTTNILIKNVLDSIIVIVCYWATGWAFAYGDDNGDGNIFIGTSQFFLSGQSDFPKFFFQYVFAATGILYFLYQLNKLEFSCYDSFGSSV